MDRDIEKTLLSWKHQTNHLPILLRGARQVGKSYIVENFGQKHFDSCFVLNFELQPELCSCFDTLHPHDILEKLTRLTRQKIEPGKTLLFLDEIQDCPNAIRALRYFKEKLPELHVIGAGSLLEFTLNQADFRMPVGRVQSLYLKPLSFKEYLTANGYHHLRSYIEQADIKNPVENEEHQLLLKQVRNYMSLGGMPSVIKAYIDSNQQAPGHVYDFNQCRLQQATLLNTYRQDFGKYAKHVQISYLQRVFEKAPGLVGAKFKYTHVDADMRIENIKAALSLLQYAGLIYYIYHSNASGIPLASLINEKQFKILFLDVGLMGYASRIDQQLLQDDFLLVNRGALAKQFVGQELLAYNIPYEEAHLYYWHREKKSSNAEVDFITTVGANIIPIEVKAGATGRLKSLHLLMQENHLPLGVRISQQALAFDGKILSVPIYMVGEMERLIRAI